MIWLLGARIEMRIELVPGWYYCCNAGRILSKEKCCLLEAHMDVMQNGGVGGDLDAGVASCQKIPQFSVVDDIDGPVVFCYPFDEMCATLNY